MDGAAFKDNVFNQLSRVGKVLSSPKRLEILDLLSQGPKSVESLSAITRMSVANTSKHLQALLDSQLVVYRKDRNYVIYDLSDKSVIDLLLAIRTVADKQLEELAQLRQQIEESREPFESVTVEQFVDRYESGGITIIDVRPREEYEAGHIDGAISIPMGDLERYIDQLPQDQAIFAYCRGHYCLYAAEAVKLLKAKGLHAIRLDASLHDWNKYRQQ
ncbi:ArsR/SmtB family transcription factor [Paenibacillus kobensis]|uniref:ArsR/SmtB family transcription factor n=1 Tax=Paenibacillus kobensis TaxID=59841 RepID=UPI000FDCC1AC|nr:metalloregulator ArsR/SmtB family transcription factor [Paenibacillus kobensis]